MMKRVAKFWLIVRMRFLSAQAMSFDLKKVKCEPGTNDFTGNESSEVEDMSNELEKMVRPKRGRKKGSKNVNSKRKRKLLPVESTSNGLHSEDWSIDRDGRLIDRNTIVPTIKRKRRGKKSVRFHNQTFSNRKREVVQRKSTVLIWRLCTLRSINEDKGKRGRRPINREEQLTEFRGDDFFSKLKPGQSILGEYEIVELIQNAEYCSFVYRLLSHKNYQLYILRIESIVSRQVLLLERELFHKAKSQELQYLFGLNIVQHGSVQGEGNLWFTIYEDIESTNLQDMLIELAKMPSVSVDTLQMLLHQLVKIVITLWEFGFGLRSLNASMFAFNVKAMHLYLRDFSHLVVRNDQFTPISTIDSWDPQCCDLAPIGIYKRQTISMIDNLESVFYLIAWVAVKGKLGWINEMRIEILDLLKMYHIDEKSKPRADNQADQEALDRLFYDPLLLRLPPALRVVIAYIRKFSEAYSSNAESFYEKQMFNVHVFMDIIEGIQCKKLPQFTLTETASDLAYYTEKVKLVHRQYEEMRKHAYFTIQDLLLADDLRNMHINELQSINEKLMEDQRTQGIKTSSFIRHPFIMRRNEVDIVRDRTGDSHFEVKSIQAPKTWRLKERSASKKSRFDNDESAEETDADSEEEKEMIKKEKEDSESDVETESEDNSDDEDYAG